MPLYYLIISFSFIIEIFSIADFFLMSFSLIRLLIKKIIKLLKLISKKIIILFRS